MPKKPAAPVLLVRWYDYTKWLLERVDSFPKNQQFIFGTRLADAGHKQSRSARWGVQQCRQQPAVLEPEQQPDEREQQPDEREQQQQIPRFQPPEGGTSLTSQNVRSVNWLRAQCLIGEALDPSARVFI